MTPRGAHATLAALRRPRLLLVLERLITERVSDGAAPAAGDGDALAAPASPVIRR